MQVDFTCHKTPENGYIPEMASRPIDPEVDVCVDYDNIFYLLKVATLHNFSTRVEHDSCYLYGTHVARFIY